MQFDIGVSGHSATVLGHSVIFVADLQKSAWYLHPHVGRAECIGRSGSAYSHICTWNRSVMSQFQNRLPSLCLLQSLLPSLFILLIQRVQRDGD